VGPALRQHFTGVNFLFFNLKTKNTKKKKVYLGGGKQWGFIFLGVLFAGWYEIFGRG